MLRDGGTLHDPVFCFAGQCGYDVEQVLWSIVSFSVLLVVHYILNNLRILCQHLM